MRVTIINHARRKFGIFYKTSSLLVMLVFMLNSGNALSGVLSLDETIELTLSNSSLIKQSEYAQEGVRLDKDLVEEERSVNLDFNLQGGVGDVWTDDNGSQFVQEASRRPLSAILDLSYSIDIWGKNNIESKRYDEKINNVSLQTHFIKNKVILDAIDLYGNLLSDKIKIKRQKEKLSLFKGTLEDAHKELAVGLYTKPYVLQIEDSVRDEEMELSKYIQSYEEGKFKLSLLLDREIDDIDSNMPVPDLATDKADLDTLIDQAPQVKIIRSSLNIAQSEYHEAVLENKPSLKLIGNLGVQEGSIYLAERIYNYELMLKLTVPLLDVTTRNIKKNRSRVSAMMKKDELYDTRKALKSQIKRLLSKLDYHEKKMVFLQHKLKVKLSDRDALDKEYLVGKSTVMEVDLKKYDLLAVESEITDHKHLIAMTVYQINSLLGKTGVLLE